MLVKVSFARVFGREKNSKNASQEEEDYVGTNTFSDKMKSNINVLRPFMINWISSQMNSTLIIKMYDRYLLNQPKTTQNTMHPYASIKSTGQCHILGFGS